MLYEKTNSPAILMALAAITLTLVTAAGLTHYPALAVSKKGDSSSSTTKDTSTNTNPNSLTQKELKSFISCVTTANKSQGLTHKVVRTCLDTALGIPPAASDTAAAAAAAAAGTGAASAGSTTAAG
jgi:hypothetical protein